MICVSERCGYSTVVVLQLPKLATRVRFPLPALPSRFPLPAFVFALLIAGCSTPESYDFNRATRPPTQAIPSLAGSYHQVNRGDTLWRIARAYGLDVQTLADANSLPHAGHLDVGQKLFIPLPTETAQFLWPVRGSVRTTSVSPSLEIDAPAGSLVRASRHGKVAVAARNLSGWGRTVVLDHLDGSFSVYAGLDQILVNPGAELRQGLPLGSLGAQPLHFEIQVPSAPRPTLSYLPSEG